MRYLGSKARIAKYILPIILKNRKPNQWYVEPFVGGFNLIDKVDGNRLANDNNQYVISMFKAIQKGWIPPSKISKNRYLDIKNNKKYYRKYLVGFVGFGCSFSGIWFGGYAQGGFNKGIPRNYANESKNNILKQNKYIKDIIIKCGDYRDLEIPKNSIVYCDPPYKNTAKYKDDFDHDKFWKWVRKISKNHKVYISEYSAPKDFKCIWKMSINCLVAKNNKSSRIEKLFTIRKR